MPAWKPSRHPDNYPPSFHSAIQSGQSRYVLAVVRSDSQALKIKKLFSSFKASLRNYPLHPTSQAHDFEEFRYRIRVKAEFGDVLTIWLEKDRRQIKLLQSAIDRLETLPPQ